MSKPAAWSQQQREPAGGDSGAPVFVITSQDRNEVTFTGIHSGKITIDGNPFAVYSTIDQIEVGATELRPH